MKARRLPPIVLVVVSLVAASMPGSNVLAQEPAARAKAKRSIEGTWRFDSDPSFGVNFFLLISFAQGGGLVEAKSAFHPSTTTPGLGSWKHVGGRTFNYSYRKVMHSASGIPIGIFKLRGTLTVSEDGTTIETHDVIGDQFNNDESVKFFTVRGPVTGRKLPIESL